MLIFLIGYVMRGDRLDNCEWFNIASEMVMSLAKYHAVAHLCMQAYD